MATKPLEISIREIFDMAEQNGYNYQYVRAEIANAHPELNWKEIDIFIAGEKIDRRKRRRQQCGQVSGH